MKEFFEAVASCSPNVSSWILQIPEGKGRGEKAIVTNGEYVYLSRPDGVIAEHRDEWSHPAGSGLTRTDGTLLYTEQIGAEKKIVICGAGHVSLPIIKIAKLTGFHVTVIDDREHFVSMAGEAGADEVICGGFENALTSIPGDRSTFFVIVTRGHAHDEACLRAILKKKYAYVGMMGSRRRIDMVRGRLLAEEYPEDAVAGICAPIGLPIQAETPEEIAVSVMGEIIERKQRTRDNVFPKDILNDLLGQGHAEPLPGRKILCTIVSRQGSAPRGVGARMLVTDRNAQIGTIGGGLLEYKVRRKAEEMFAEDDPLPALFHAALTADAASEEGEVCGGQADILLEEIR